MGFRIKWEILDNKVLSGHHHLKQPLRDYVENVRLRLPDNCQEVMGEEKRLVIPLARSYLKQPVQSVERDFLHPLN